MGLTPSNFVKTKEEIALMRQGGKILASILDQLKTLIKPGISSWTLEEAFIDLCRKNKVIPSCKGYNPYGFAPYPTGLCVSINNQCVHCFPKKTTILKNNDIITVDATINFKGYHLDSAFAMGVGTISHNNKLLVETCRRSMEAGISQISDDVKLGKVSHAIQKTAQKAGFDVLRDYSGHGIGKDMHEWPQVLCYGSKNDGPKLRSGMTICVEALLCSGKPKVKNLSVWETEMADGGSFCQFEHTVLVLDRGYEILTLSH